MLKMDVVMSDDYCEDGASFVDFPQSNNKVVRTVCVTFSLDTGLAPSSAVCCRIGSATLKNTNHSVLAKAQKLCVTSVGCGTLERIV
jgi:hypothetical protein